MYSKRRLPYVDIMALHPEVTGSCELVIVKFPEGRTTRFIVDCGMFQEHEHTEYNKGFPFEPKNIEFCVVTHNHIDHTGRLPLLVKKGFSGRIFTTKPTSYLIPLALEDSCKLVRDMGKRNCEKPLYTESDVTETERRVRAIEYGETKEVSKGIKITMFKNGHLVGAAIVLVQISAPGCEDINLLFTGDYNERNIFFDVPDLPDWVLELPITIIQESTYGTTESIDVKETFENNLLSCLKNNGTAVNMVFSLGRFQEILYKLRKMQEEGKLSVNVPIYADGKLGIRYTSLFLSDVLGLRKGMEDFLPENLTFIGKESRNEVLASNKSKIIVTTSGMGTYGPAPQYIRTYLKQKNALIQFTGYTSEGTLGERLKNTPEDEIVVVGGILCVKRAKVEYTTEFSSHAKADQMIEFLKQFKNINLILVNHGETETKEEFTKRLLKEVDEKDVGILDRSYLYRVGHYGLIKTMATGFE